MEVSLEHRWRPHGDSNPGSYRERVVSWTGLDDGDQPRNGGTYEGTSSVQGFFPSAKSHFSVWQAGP